MKLKTSIIALAFVIAVLLWARRPVPTQQLQLKAVIDLSHPISDKNPTYDPSEKFQAHTVSSYGKDGYFARDFCMPEHFGTHLDAPAHFSQGRWTVDQIPPERLAAPLVVLDVSAKAAGRPDYLVSVEDIAAWEQTNGQVPPGAVVVARTGWDSRWSDAAKYRNPDTKGVMHFPGWSLDAARFLVEGRDIFGLGIDTLSVDVGPSKDFPVHHLTAPHGVYNLENVADLATVPKSGAIVVVAPIKLQGGSGGPVRIMALVK